VSDEVKVPLFATRVSKPARGSLAWYAGLGIMAAFEVIEWPVALIVAAGHAVATNARNPEARELAEGTEAGA
jgi:uncharacterized membrane protein YjdF